MLKGIKNKFLRFKQIFQDAWYDFIPNHPRYNSDYYKNEINKMLNCSCSYGGFAKYKCTAYCQCEHTVHMSCKGKSCPQCGKRYARDSMVKIASKLFKGINYHQIVALVNFCQFLSLISGTMHVISGPAGMIDSSMLQVPLPKR